MIRSDDWTVTRQNGPVFMEPKDDRQKFLLRVPSEYGSQTQSHHVLRHLQADKVRHLKRHRNRPFANRRFC
jgi:hypothetical protein